MEPQVDVFPASADVRAVAVVLHGGRSRGHGRVNRYQLAVLRMVPFGRALHAAGRRHGLEVRMLRYRVRGWNAPDLDPVRDARWALAEVEREHPGVPVVLVGHSMGGRTALRVADHPTVVAVCALAPWIEPGEPEPRSQVPIVIAHGDGDQVTDPAASAAYAARVGASFVPVPGETHALLRRPVFWTRLVTGFVASALDVDSHAR